MDNPAPEIPYKEKTDPFSSHSLIINRIKNLDPGTRILDVGTAGGTIGRRLKDKGLIVNGIEPIAAWADVAIPFYDALIVSSIEDTPDEFLKDYDVVICADVLEHLVDPLQVLTRLVKLQGDDAIYLLSVPNVANFWIRLNLLFGRFNYTDRGILDKTHLHFYTLKSFVNLIDRAGLKIISLYTTPVPLNIVNPIFESTAGGQLAFRFLANITRFLPGFLGYQFIVEAHG